MSLVIMMTFICMGIGAVVVKGTLRDQLTTGCSQDHGIIHYMDEIYAEGSEIICSSSCTCDANSRLWSSDIGDQMHTDSTGVNMLTECPDD